MSVTRTCRLPRSMAFVYAGIVVSDQIEAGGQR